MRWSKRGLKRRKNMQKDRIYGAGLRGDVCLEFGGSGGDLGKKI